MTDDWICIGALWHFFISALEILLLTYLLDGAKHLYSTWRRGRNIIQCYNRRRWHAAICSWPLISSPSVTSRPPWLRHTEIVKPYSVARRQGCWCGSCLWVQQRRMMLTRCYKERWKTVQDAAGHKTEPLARSPHRFAAKSAEIQRSKTSH